MSETTTSIITIGRQYGSAGRYIGQEIAKYFGIKYYDKELLAYHRELQIEIARPNMLM